MSLQIRIFEQIIARHASKSEAVGSLTKLLKTSKSSLYRKMSDTSALKPNEITLLSQHYGLSLDELVQADTNQYLFRYYEGLFPVVFEGQENKNDHPLPLDISDKTLSLSYTGLELPIYYLCYYPELIHFKKHIWNKANLDKYQNNYDVIDFSNITNDEHQYYNQTIRYYEQIKTIELWDKKIFALTIEEIKYAFQVGILTYDDAKMLISLINRLINRLERMLRAGSKTFDKQSDNLSVYYNPVTSANSLYFIENETTLFVQSTFDTPRSMIATSQHLIDNAQTRFKALKRQSHLISVSGEIERATLLNGYRIQLDRLILQLDF